MPVLMLYDGLCGFCNSSVQWLLKRDKHDQFRFAPQQSKLAQEVLSRHGLVEGEMPSTNTVYLVTDLGSAAEKLLQRSDVAVQSLFHLGGIWKVLGYCLQIVPRFVRDAGYALIARNRYRLAGRYETCPLPSSAQRAKFVGLTDL
jgi:predicted DCC family thiol-disulfide oxidoreductase YuxK